MRVVAVPVVSRQRWAPRSRKWLTTLIAVEVVPGPSHLSVRRLARVVGHVDAMKHFLSATFAPMSRKNCRDNLMPVTVAEAWFIRDPYKKRSSASTLGDTWEHLI